MKENFSKGQAQEKINDFFARKDFTSEEARKIKRLAMKYRIRLKGLRKNFCKNCFSRLKGIIRVTKTYKTVRCSKCNSLNRFKIE